MYPDSYPTKYTAILSDFVHKNLWKHQMNYNLYNLYTINKSKENK